MQPKRQSFRGKTEKIVVHRMSQAERARTIAAQCNSSYVADLLEAHAELCERNAASMALKGRRPHKGRGSHARLTECS